MSKPILTRWAAECGVKFVKALRARLEAVTDDEAAIRDTIEGEVDVDPIMEKLIALRQEQKALAAAHRDLARGYAEAARADEAREEKIKALILECLQEAGQDQWKGVAGTASIRAGGWSVEVLEPAHIPFQYMKPVPDIDKINKELTALRIELEAMGDDQLIDAAIVEGVPNLIDLRSFPVPALDRGMLINACLAKRIPGAALVLGEDTLTITPPRGRKATT